MRESGAAQPWVSWVAAALLVSSAGCWSGYPRVHVSHATRSDDPGQPLFLTPLLDAGRADEARRLARVPATHELGIESYSGYFTVDPAHDSNLFAWYFPCVSRAQDAPLVVWLQGGPGATSLFGLFEEHGPVLVRDGRLIKREYTWAQYHDVVYVDNPVGTGFSFSNSTAGLCRDEECVGRGLRELVVQLVRLLPELRGRDLYVTGESYAGKYVPAAGRAILRGGAGGLRLAGLAIGNGLTDPANQLLYAPYLYQHGLLDAVQRDEFAAREDAVRAAIRAGRYERAFTLFDSLLNGDLTPYGSLFYNMTGYRYYFNLLQSEPSPPSEWPTLVGSAEMRRSLHVGAREFSSGEAVERALTGDVMRSVRDCVAEVLEGGVRVLAYNGQLDIIVAYPLTENYLRLLEWSGSTAFRGSARIPWRVGNELAGYARSGGNLTEVLVRDAGHMAPADQPRWLLDLITRFTRSKPFH